MNRGLSLFLVVCVSLLSLGVNPGSARSTASFVVNSTTDAVDAAPGDGICATAGGVCTLRAAIQEANALAGDDIITLPAGTYMLTIVGTGDTAAGDLDITQNLSINGAGASLTIINGGAIDRVFHVNGSITVSISSVTITNGNGGGSSGGILNSGGTLTIIHSTLSSNTADFGGGIVNSAGILTVTNTTFSNNSAGMDYAGGGIYTVSGVVNIMNSTFSGNSGGLGGGIYKSSGTLTVDNSTFSSNSADGGGGIANFGSGTVNIINTTISGNSAGLNGGGISNTGTMTITNSTLSNNSAVTNGGGISNFGGGTIRVKNTIIAGNINPNNIPDCSSAAGSIISDGHNLVGKSDGCNWSIATGDLVGTIATPVDPKLDSLADNGGSTQTHALFAGSPAIDSGNPATPGSGGNACPTIDQRGVTRPQGSRCDIGAYEFANPSLTINYADGKPGSFFTVTGINFPPSRTATIIINGNELTNTLTVDTSGGIAFLLSTTQGDPGRYFVTATVNPSATVGFTLDSNAPLRPQEGDGPIINVPNGIAFTEFVYLPLIQR